jgi:hypothetical protein
MSNDVPSVLDNDNAEAELLDSSGRLGRKGVEAVVGKTNKAGPTSKSPVNPGDEEAAIQFFLSDDNDVEDTFGLTVPRVNLRFTFRSIRENELKTIQRRAATGKRLPNGNKEVDMMRFYRMVLIETMVTPNLRHPDVIEKFGRPEDALASKLQPGEIDGLAEKVLVKSGFHDDSVIEDEDVVGDVSLAKN